VRFGAQGRALLAGHRHVSGVAAGKALSYNGEPDARDA
jgi:hypothetical protein